MPPGLPSSPAARVALLLGASAIVVFGVIGGRGFMERRAEVREFERLRSGLADLRVAAEECQAAVEREEQAFEDYQADVDSLRREVRALEALDERGIPADRYREYLEAFDEYNESLPLWEERGDSLRALSEECRAMVQRHNALADSLRELVEEGEPGG